MAGLPCRRVGEVTDDGRVVVRMRGESWLDVSVAELRRAFEGTLRDA
jgi:hypothetical protein